MRFRYDFLATAVLLAASAGHVAIAQDQPFQLPPLPYAYDALEPYIDAQTLKVHHGGHHATYVRNLNAAVAGRPEVAGKTIEQLLANLDALPGDLRTAIRNNGGGHYNHSLYWQIMSPKGGGAPTGELARAIEKTFGSFARFQEEFTRAALGVFGSGWAWLTVDSAGQLRVETSANQDTPLSAGRTPILCIDVWEHAYYLRYQNRRAEYIKAFYNVIDWKRVGELYLTARK